MVAHVVIFTWISDARADAVARLRAALDSLAAEVAGIGRLRHGFDLGYRSGNGDYALVATFADRAAWDAYQAHPAHQAFVRDHIMPLAADRRSIQFDDGATA